MRALVALLLLALPSLVIAQSDPSTFPTVSICDVMVDEDENCITDAVGEMVCVEGIVLAWQEYGTRGPGAIYDPATGCAISVFDINNQPNIPAGTLVRVCGWVGNFAGLAEFTDDPTNGSNDPVITILDAGPLPENPVPASGADLADFSPLAEQLESRLVQLCGQFVDTGDFFPFSANYNFEDLEGNTIQVRIDSDTGIQGTPIPSGYVTVLGVLSQFNVFQDQCIGYQVLPRSVNDFLAPTCQVDLELQPGDCPNSINTTSRGVYSAAILGSADFDVSQIDPTTVQLEGVSAMRWSISDVSTPSNASGDVCECATNVPDGHPDLTLKFSNPAIVAALGSLEQNATYPLTVTGNYVDGSAFQGQDCVEVHGFQRGTPGRLGGMRLNISRDALQGQTLVSYVLSEQARVRLSVYNVAGRLVQTLVDADQPAGQHTMEWSSGDQPSGLYLFRLQTGQDTETQKFVLMN